MKKTIVSCCICTIAVLESPVMQTAVNMVTSVYTPAKPVHVCKTYQEVPELVREDLRRAESGHVLLGA